MILNLIKVLIFLIIIISPVFSQKENWLWYSGGGAITFNTPDTMPKYLFNLPFKFGSDIYMTVCDKDANLLFYSDSDSIWNREHKLMPNGFTGNYCAPSLICDKPGNKKEYILFNINNSKNPKLLYSIIDLELDNGLGDIKLKNVFIDSNITHFNIAYHPNGIDLWIIVFSGIDKLFKSYLLTKDSITLKHVISFDKVLKFKIDKSNKLDWLIISPDNKKIVKYYTHVHLGDSTYNIMELYMFDDRNGIIRYITSITNFSYSKYKGSYGTTLPYHLFSSNSKYIYIYLSHDFIPGLQGARHCLFQYYLEENDTTINIQKNLIYDSIPRTQSKSASTFWLAPNRKLYFIDNTPFNLGEISFPDSFGIKCKFNPLANRTPFRFTPSLNAYYPCYYCFYASVKEPVCEGDTIYLEGNLSARFLSPEFYWTGPNGFTSKERNPFIPNAGKQHSGLYKLYVKADTALLFDSVYVKVLDRQIAKIKVNGSLQLCRNVTVELESEYKRNNYTYQWSNGSNKGKISVNKGGVYKLYVTNEAGCVGVDSVEVFDPPEVRLNSDKEGLCYGETAKISFETNFKNLSFVWSTGAIDSSINVSSPGIYKLYYEFGNCRDSQEIKINDYGKIGARIIGDSVVCKGDSVWLQAYPQLYNYKYLWSTGSKEYEIKESGTKKIFLIIENQYGCKDTAYINLREIDRIKAKIVGGSGICKGQTKKLRAEPYADEYEYRWSTGDKGKEITIGEPGIYYVEISVKGRCKATDTIQIYEAEPPTPQITGSEYICPGRTSSLFVNDKYLSYKWNTGDTTKEITIDKAGRYSVTVTDTNGCQGTASFEVKEYDVSVSLIGETKLVRTSIGKSRTSILHIKNESNSELEILNIFAKNSPDVFEIKTNPSLPHTLKQNEELEIEIAFKPGEAKIYEDSIIIEKGKPCRDVLASQITGEGINAEINSRVWLPDTTAQIGTENYRLPLKGKLAQDTTINDMSYKAEIRIAADYYLPEALTKGTLEGSVIEKGERIIRIRGNVATISGNETVLTEITGLVLLGRPEPAMLKISSFEWSEPEIKVKKDDGSLKVEGVCNQGFSWIEMTERISFEIAENPVREELKLIIRGKISEGANKIRIYNTLGECVLVEQASLTVQRLDISSLSPGVYFIRLGDWMGRFVKIE